MATLRILKGPDNPQGTPAREKTRICALTFTWSKDDPHPADAGYRVIAGAVFAASGFKHL